MPDAQSKKDKTSHGIQKDFLRYNYAIQTFYYPHEILKSKVKEWIVCTTKYIGNRV